MKDDDPKEENSFSYFFSCFCARVVKFCKYVVKKIYKAVRYVASTSLMQTIGAPILDVLDDIRNIIIGKNAFGSFIHAVITVGFCAYGVTLLYVYPSYKDWLIGYSSNFMYGIKYLDAIMINFIGSWVFGFPMSKITMLIMRGTRYLLYKDPDHVLRVKDARKIARETWEDIRTKTDKYNHLKVHEIEELINVAAEGVLEIHDCFVQEIRKNPIKRDADKSALEQWVGFISGGQIESIPIDKVYKWTKDKLSKKDGKDKTNLKDNEPESVDEDEDIIGHLLNLGYQRKDINKNVFENICTRVSVCEKLFEQIYEKEVKPKKINADSENNNQDTLKKRKSIRDRDPFDKQNITKMFDIDSFKSYPKTAKAISDYLEFKRLLYHMKAKSDELWCDVTKAYLADARNIKLREEEIEMDDFDNEHENENLLLNKNKLTSTDIERANQKKNSKSNDVVIFIDEARKHKKTQSINGGIQVEAVQLQVEEEQLQETLVLQKKNQQLQDSEEEQQQTNIEQQQTEQQQTEQQQQVEVETEQQQQVEVETEQQKQLQKDSENSETQKSKTQGEMEQSIADIVKEKSPQAVCTQYNAQLESMSNISSLVDSNNEKGNQNENQKGNQSGNQNENQSGNQNEDQSENQKENNESNNSDTLKKTVNE